MGLGGRSSKYYKMFSIVCETYSLRTGTNRFTNKNPERIVQGDARTEIEVCINGTTGPNLIVSNKFAARHKPDFGFAAKAVGQATTSLMQNDRIADERADVGIQVISRRSSRAAVGPLQAGHANRPNDRFGSTIEIRMEKAVDVVAVGICGNSRQRVIHISTAAAVIFLGLQVA